MPTCPPVLLGARLPRVSSHPPYEYTYGPEVIELAASAGLMLDPWEQDAVTVQVAMRPDGKWACFEAAEIVSRQNGKGAIGEARVLGGLYLFGEELIMWSAHEYKTALEAFRRVRGWIDNTDDLRRRVKRITNTNGEEGIELVSGQRLRFLARSKSSGRGFSGDLNIIDEAFAYTDDQQAALMPTMSARPNPQILYLSSPPLDTLSGGPLFALRRRGESGHDPSLSWRDWGLSGSLDKLDRVDLDDQRIWAATNPALGIRITLETIERERRSMSDVGFARERLGIWPPPPPEDADFAVIPAEVWRARRDTRSRIAEHLALAIDTTPDRSVTYVGVAGKRSDGSAHIEIIKEFVGTAGVARWVADRKRRHRAVAVVVDGTRAAASIIPDLEDLGVEVTKTNARDMASACGRLYDGLVSDDPDQRVWHIGQGPLDAAAAAATKRKLGDAWAWDGYGIAPIVCVTLALHGLTTAKGSAPWVAYA